MDFLFLPSALFFVTLTFPRNRFHWENYVIDFVFIPGDEKKKFVIELNPFHPDTNGTLYRWSHDLEELKNGPLHFWVRPDYYPRGLELFSQRFLHYFPSPLLNMLK
eukprot:TRINITY_DN1023_c0_g1_i10.p1 TRINITY_DN1023_c0_g1~~TRINITY_DN1023_c0_g1_i10.p1  ORF type:complete len:106 (+),score=19.81 TRINITY_DN1023_c0_g1_i10:389-706(+)